MASSLLTSTPDLMARGSRASFADPSSFGLGEAAERRRREQAQLRAQLQRAGLGAETQRSTRDLTRAYQQGAEPQITGYAQRGLGRSGLFNRAMQDYIGQYQRGIGDIAQRQQLGEAGIQLGDQISAEDLQDALDRLRLQTQSQIIADAAALRDFAPMTGLFS